MSQKPPLKIRIKLLRKHKIFNSGPLCPLTKNRPISEDDEESAEVFVDGKENIRRTPKKSRISEIDADNAEVRRSPRKHPGSRNPGFSKLTITGSAIVQQTKVMCTVGI